MLALSTPGNNQTLALMLVLVTFGASTLTTSVRPLRARIGRGDVLIDSFDLFFAGRRIAVEDGGVDGLCDWIERADRREYIRHDRDVDVAGARFSETS